MLRVTSFDFLKKNKRFIIVVVCCHVSGLVEKKEEENDLLRPSRQKVSVVCVFIAVHAVTRGHRPLLILLRLSPYLKADENRLFPASPPCMPKEEKRCTD